LVRRSIVIALYGALNTLIFGKLFAWLSAKMRSLCFKSFSVKLMFRRMSLISPELLPANGLRSWVLDQLRREGEPLRWAITSIDRSPETSRAVLEVEAVLIHS